MTKPKLRAQRLPDELVRKAYVYQLNERCNLTQVSRLFDVHVFDLKYEFRRHGFYCAKIPTRKKRISQEVRVTSMPRAPDHLVLEAHAWYLTNEGTINDAARRFGISYDWMQRRMAEMSLPTKAHCRVKPEDLAFVEPFRAQIQEWDQQRARRQERDR